MSNNYYAEPQYYRDDHRYSNHPRQAQREVSRSSSRIGQQEQDEYLARLIQEQQLLSDRHQQQQQLLQQQQQLGLGQQQPSQQQQQQQLYNSNSNHSTHSSQHSQRSYHYDDPAADDRSLSTTNSGHSLLDDVSMPDSVQMYSQHRQQQSMHHRYHGNSMVYEEEPSSSAYQHHHHHHHQQQQQHMLVRNNYRKNVCFADEALMYSCNYSYEEILRMWYTRNELANFKTDRKEIVKILKKHKFNLALVEKNYGNDCCLRGYEPYFSVEGNKEIRRNRDLVVQTVLQEQKNQRNNSSPQQGRRSPTPLNHERIAKYCSDASKWARDNAQRLGVQDANEVMKTYTPHDFKARDPNAVWDRIIEDSLEETCNVQEQEYIQQAMEYSMMESQHSQSQGNHQHYHHDNLRSHLERSNSEELMRQQLALLQQDQDPAADVDDPIYLMEQEQLRLLQQERDRQQQLWLREQEEQQQREQRSRQEQEQLYERQQMLQLQQLEQEQQRQQENLRRMQEEQRRMEDEFRRRNGTDTLTEEDEIEIALRLSEALQFQNNM